MDKKVILAFSGGLDTSFCVLYLKEQGYDVVTVTVNTGGFGEKEKDVIANQAKMLGVSKHIWVDAQKEFYNKIIAYVIKGNILRGGVYPLCAGPERSIIAEKLVEIAQAEEADFVAHGSTGAGNDQVRFDMTINVLSPDLKILTPIRDLRISREEEVKFLKKHSIPVAKTTKKYSVNKGLLGTTIGGSETKNAWDSLPEEAYANTVKLSETPDSPQEIILSFENGLPVKIDRKEVNGVEIMNILQKMGNLHGTGKGIHMGNTILGIKGRIGFVAPAALILIKAHVELEKLVLTKWQMFWKETLCSAYGNFLHEALYFDPVMRDIEAMIDSSQKYVSGDVKVKLFKGNILIGGCRSEYSLMSRETATYGEENVLWNGEEAKGFIKIYGLQSRQAAHRELKVKSEKFSYKVIK